MQLGALLALTLLGMGPAAGEPQSPPPPSVGTIKVAKQSVTETEKFIGRIQAVNRYSAVARITANLEKVVFTEGQDVSKGDVLYQLEQPPFQADVDSKKGTVANIQAQLKGADQTLARSSALMQSPAGLQSKVDSDRAQQGSLQGQLQSAQADLKTSQINLSYTTITSPIDGKVGRTSVTIGNIVTPDSGILTTVVSQDPMYALFSIPTRTLLDLRNRYANKGGFEAAKLKLVLPDGRQYGQAGRLDFVDNTISTATDSSILRGKFANPPIRTDQLGRAVRELIDGEFVTVIFESAQPESRISIPRSSVLTDQRGDYVYVVTSENKAQRQDLELGQAEGADTIVNSGLNEGQVIVVDNLQRVRPGQPVMPTDAQSSLLHTSSVIGR